MRANGLHGLSKAKSPRTTLPATAGHPQDKVGRVFTADAPDKLWVADITYIRSCSGWVYAAFVMDMFSRRIVGWQVSTSLHTTLALHALEMGIWVRQRTGADLTGLIHHSDRGVQYRAVRYTERLEEEELVASVGSKGDSYDNAAAEALNSTFKTELIRNPKAILENGPWKSVDDIEIAVAEWVDWSRYAGDVRPGRWDRGARVTASIGDRSWASHRACFVPLVHQVVS